MCAWNLPGSADLLVKHTVRAQAKSSAQFGYLAEDGPEGLGPVLRQSSVFLCVDELRGRGVYGLHLPMRQRCASQCCQVLCTCRHGPHRRAYELERR